MDAIDFLCYILNSKIVDENYGWRIVLLLLQGDSWPELVSRYFELAATAAMVKSTEASGGLDTALGALVGATPLSLLGPFAVLQSLTAGAHTGEPTDAGAARLPLVRPYNLDSSKKSDNTCLLFGTIVRYSEMQIPTSYSQSFDCACRDVFELCTSDPACASIRLSVKAAFASGCHREPQERHQRRHRSSSTQLPWQLLRSCLQVVGTARFGMKKHARKPSSRVAECCWSWLPSR